MWKHLSYTKYDYNGFNLALNDRSLESLQILGNQVTHVKITHGWKKKSKVVN